MREQEEFVVLVRHEQSEANAALEVSSNRLHYSVCGSDLMLGLTAHGDERSTILGQQLGRRFPAEQPLIAAISSKYLRAIRTRDRIVAALPYQVKLQTDIRLNKRSYGTFWNLTYRGVEELHPHEYVKFRERGPLAYRPPDGENYFDLFDRSTDFASSVCECTRGNLLVVTHLVVILAFMRRYEGISDNDVVRMYEDIAIPNGHILIYKRSAGTLQRVPDIE